MLTEKYTTKIIISIISITILVPLSFSGFTHVANAQLSEINTLNTYGVIQPTFREQYLEWMLLAWGSNIGNLDPLEAGRFGIVGGPDNMGDRVQVIHDANNETQVLFYRSSRDINKNRPEWQIFFDNGWLARDADGDLLVMRNWRNDYVIQYDNPAVQEFLVNWITNSIQDDGYDGCFLDWGAAVTVNMRYYGVVKEGTDIASIPVKMDGSAWTDQDLLDCHVSFTNLIKQNNPNALVIGNGLNSGSRWNLHQDKFEYLWQNGGYDGFYCEFTWWASTSWHTVDKWELSVEMNTWATSEGIIIINDARQWRMSTFKAPRDAPEDNLMFAYCSTLMAYSQYTPLIPYQFGQPDHTILRPLVYNLMETDLGNPLGTYSRMGTNVYTREFEHATVYVNPSGVAETVNGILLQPRTGTIIMK